MEMGNDQTDGRHSSVAVCKGRQCDRHSKNSMGLAELDKDEIGGLVARFRKIVIPPRFVIHFKVPMDESHRPHMSVKAEVGRPQR